MHVKVITLRFDQLLEAFDDRPLREFVKDKDMLSIRDHFFVRNETPYLAAVVTYAPQPVVQPAAARAAGSRLEVGEADMPLFNAMRDWRAERSKKEGVPPYMICTNRQLAAILRDKPRRMGKLGEIQGIGKAKLEKYGEELLAMVALAPDSVPADRPPAPASPGGNDATAAALPPGKTGGTQ